ncbi:platelet-activating factor acetylhydrolase [Blastocladiella britannica]|nr:platelet-activating factor acetylhydrolase [Blastocladiella britannica]
MVFTHFPNFTGPFPVAVADHEWPDAFSPTDERLFALDGVRPQSLLVRVFYPTTRAATPAERPRWLSDHEGQGYGDFIRMPRFLSRPLFSTIFRSAKVPTVPNGELAPAGSSAVTSSSPALPEKLPVVVFSHGLGGCKGTYQYFAGDLASRGAVVFAIEHRDQSACISFEKFADDSNTPDRSIPYLRGSTLGTDAVAVKLRRTQVLHRAAEVRRTVALIRRIARGEVPANTRGSTSPLAALAGRLDLDTQLLAGHSFGGATTVEVLQQQHARVPGADADEDLTFRAALVMDPWMMPTDPSLGISVPTLISSSETFHWKSNSVAMAEWTRASAGTKESMAHVTLKGLAHQNHSDMPILIPRLMQASKMAGPADPRVAVLRNNAAWADFLTTHGVRLPAPEYTPADLCLSDSLDGASQSTILKEAEAEAAAIGGASAAVSSSTATVLNAEHPEVLVGWAKYVSEHGIEDPYVPEE